MFEIEFSALSVPDVEEWQAELQRAAVAALPAVGEVLLEQALSCFDTSTDPWGNAWQAFSPNTPRGRVAGSKLLVDTGLLRLSLHVQIDATPDGGAIVRVVAGGPAAAYAAVHQWGSQDGVTPARPFLALIGDPDAPTVLLPPDVELEIMSMLQLAIDQTVDRLNAAQGQPRR